MSACGTKELGVWGLESGWPRVGVEVVEVAVVEELCWCTGDRYRLRDAELRISLGKLCKLSRRRLPGRGLRSVVAKRDVGQLSLISYLSVNKVNTYHIV